MLMRRSKFIWVAGLLLAVLSGCGGSGDDSESGSSGGFKNISVTPLDSQAREYYERQTVTLSLNTIGDNTAGLSYAWTVEFDGRPVSFSGQNTQTIRFRAPEVDRIGTVRVTVTMGSNDNRLLGQNRYTSSISIYDTDPLKASSQGVIESGLSTSLPEVDSLDQSLMPEDTTWRLNTFVNKSTQDSLGVSGEFYIATQQIVYFELNSDDDISVRRCGSDVLTSFMPTSSQISCGGTYEKKFYQSPSAYRIEEVCDGAVRYANNFSKLRDHQAGSFGEVSLTFSSNSDYSSVSNVCGAVSESIIVVHEDSNSDGIPDNAVVASGYAELHGQYEGSPIKITINSDSVSSHGSYFLSDFFDREERNDIKFSSPALSKFDGLSAEDGRMTVLRTASGIEVDVDAEMLDIDNDTEVVEGTFSLTFE